MALLIFKAKLFLNVLWILMKCMSEKVRERERRGRWEKEGGRKEKEGGRREKRGGSREKHTPLSSPSKIRSFTWLILLHCQIYTDGHYRWSLPMVITNGHYQFVITSEWQYVDLKNKFQKFLNELLHKNSLESNIFYLSCLVNMVYCSHVTIFEI